MHCYCRFKIYTLHIHTFHRRCQKFLPCVVKHDAELPKFRYIKWRSRKKWDIGCMFLWPIFLFWSIELWSPVSETPCIIYYDLFWCVISIVLYGVDVGVIVEWLVGKDMNGTGRGVTGFGLLPRHFLWIYPLRIESAPAGVRTCSVRNAGLAFRRVYAK